MREFQEWVDSIGGSPRLAEKLGTTPRAVRQWYNRKGWPKVQNILDIIRLSKGKLTFEGIVASTRSPRGAKNAK